MGAVTKTTDRVGLRLLLLSAIELVGIGVYSGCLWRVVGTEATRSESCRQSRDGLKVPSQTGPSLKDAGPSSLNNPLRHSSPSRRFSKVAVSWRVGWHQR